ncbi:lipoprotein-releasing ABC transporter permease subunit [bacterium]|nr:MAG: lipoprotein-releasing ABC transporter permease subunit [bacterium]
MRFELFVAKRYLTAKRKQAFISVITLISILGITIGVMALVIAIALITGFQEDVQDKILGATSHIMVSDLSGDGLKDYPGLMERIRGLKGVVSVTPVVYSQVLINGPSRSSGALLKGIDFGLEMKNSAWLRKLESGSAPQAGPQDGLLLGREIAFTIGAGQGDSVTVLTTASRLSPMGLFPKTKRFKVSGIFNTGLYEFDSSTALVPLETAQRFLGFEKKVTYLQVKISNIFEAESVGERIKEGLPPLAYVTTWMELNRSLFSALKLEKNIMFLTITLIVFVAALNIIATLILMVMEKTRDIGILMAMGATARQIRRIFFLQGALIGVVGTTMGVLLGLAWCWMANTFRLIRIPVDIYQISYVPFRLGGFDLILIIGVSLAISFLSTLFPSHRAAKTDPVVALKYE